MVIDWYTCKGFEGYLEVTKFGDIRSIDRIVVRCDTLSSVPYKGINLVAMKDKLGYMRMRLSVNNKKVTKLLHRLIAYTFLDNPNNLPQVNHKDGNKTNNSVTNLEWCDNRHNQVHAINTGLKEIKFGEGSMAFTGSVEAYKDSKLIATMSGNKEMFECGFDYRLVSAVLMGKRKSHKGCTFIKLYDTIYVSNLMNKSVVDEVTVI